MVVAQCAGFVAEDRHGVSRNQPRAVDSVTLKIILSRTGFKIAQRCDHEAIGGVHICAVRRRSEFDWNEGLVGVFSEGNVGVAAVDDGIGVIPIGSRIRVAPL